MKKITFLYFLFLSVISFAQSVATYNIEFTNYWNATNHSENTTFPGSNAHWSPLVGVNHNSNVTFVAMGTAATTGVENIAETGSFSAFQNTDVQNAITANNAQQFFNAGDLFLNEPTDKIIFNGLEVNENFPLLTMLSMIAPSPDWMIAVNGLELREAGSWKTSITMDLFPYDAGTEDGTTYSLANPATTGGVVTSLAGTDPFDNTRVAQLTITLASVLSTDDTRTIEKITVFPNPVTDKLSLTNIQNSNLKSIEIYNVLGKLDRTVFVKNNVNTLDVDVSNLTSGIYLLKLNNEEGNSKIQKLIVQ